MLRWSLVIGTIVALLVAAFVGFVLLKYRGIVSAKPGNLATEIKARAVGREVNPFSGTGGWPWMCGNNFPGAMVPFGMVRLGPETVSFLGHKRALNTSGYFYGDDQLLGFSHTRLNGTGATDGGHFLVVPAVKSVEPARFRHGQTTKFSHQEEIAFPGYYAVNLRELNTLAEYTATARVGVHRYTFRGDACPRLVLDVMNALGGKRSSEGFVRVLPEAREVEASVRTFGTFGGRYGGLKVFCVARFDHPFTAFATWQDDARVLQQTTAEGKSVGADFEFAAGQRPSVVTLKLALSHVSLANARANLEAEAVGKSFDEIAGAAQQAWEDKLSLIKIQGGTEQQRRIFYTALFRTFQMPTVFNDANGDYLGFDRKVHRVTDFQYFTDLSMWDTFRTTHPLYALIAPSAQRDMVVSLVKMAEQGGWLPRWPSGHGYSNSMLGTPADIVIAETWLKGIRDFDVEQAYAAMRRTALAPTPPGAAFSGREGVESYLKYGYCPAGMDESVARTFEFGWADHAIANLAEALGKADDAKLFRQHSQFYRNLFNTNSQFFQPRDAEGKFFEPFKPELLTYFDTKGKYTRDYVEGSAWQWRWSAPYDAAGMIALFKSREYFVSELDRFFAQTTPALGPWQPGPFYWHGNQPDIHAAYLFNKAGRPDLTQKWSRWILDHKYADDYVGLDGNDDGGTLSAWYIFGSLGFYPIAGTDRYELGAPLFPRAEVKLAKQPLVIVAENHAPGRIYAPKVWLNETPLDRWWIRHSEIVNGGTLKFEMSDTPPALR